MKQTNASPKHSSWVYYLGTLAMLASMLLLPHLIPSWADGIDLRKRDVSLAEKKESSRQDIETVYGHTHAWLCVVN